MDYKAGIAYKEKNAAEEAAEEADKKARAAKQVLEKTEDDAKEAAEKVREVKADTFPNKVGGSRNTTRSKGKSSNRKSMKLRFIY